MNAVLDALPLVAAGFAVPQFVPQLLKVRRGSAAGVSWSWAALTCVNNTAWCAYFALSAFWSALVPVVAVTLLSGALALEVTRYAAHMPKRPAALTLAWAAALIVLTISYGRAGLGSALAAAFVLQATPSVLTVYRSSDTSGVSIGTWLMIFAELLSWGMFGVHVGDPRLIVLGITGVVASQLVVVRALLLRRRRARLSVASQPRPRGVRDGALPEMA
jgi:uncharacterized protein with PQ loop repeat